MSTNSIPKGYDSLIPSLVVRDAAKIIAFYQAVFDAKVGTCMKHPDSDKIMHAELRIRDHVLMLGDECPQMGYLAPQPGAPKPARSVMIYVDDVDGVFNRAIAHGATVEMPVMDMFWGDRYGKFIDPAGHLWGVATHIRDVSPEECAEAAANWGKKETAEVAA